MNQAQDELELLKRVAKGEASAFRILSDEHLSRIVNFAYRMLHDRGEAEDVAQESLLRLWQEAGHFEPRARVGTWLHRVAHNLCIDRQRRRSKRPSDLLEDAPSSQEPAGLLDRKQTASAVQQALAELPERQHAAIVLVHYQGLGNIEAAQVMGVGVDALESLLARGRRTLRVRLAALSIEGGGP